MEKKYNNHLTNPYLKVLVRLSALIAVLLLVGINTSYAQWGATVNVSNDTELMEAMDNEKVQEIILEPGFYGYLDVYAEGDTRIFKAENKNNRDETCQFIIFARRACWNTPLRIQVATEFPIPGDPTSGDCPLADTGEWEFPLEIATINGAPYDPLTTYNLYNAYDVTVTGPGSFLFQYTWPTGDNVAAFYTWHPYPEPDQLPDVSDCVSITLPPLTVGRYFSGTGGTGDEYFEGDVITESMTMYIYAESGTSPNCPAETSFEITIFGLPEVECPNDFAVCIDVDPFELTGATPTGGTYSGTGVDAAGEFSPLLAGIGEHVITYTYTDANNCTNTCEFTITVNPLPIVTCPDDIEVCIDASPFTLIGEDPTGGVFTGEGVLHGIFDPEVAGVGDHVITYTYTDPDTQCTNSCEFNITVYPLPVMDCPDDFAVCIDVLPFVLPVATPIDGTYSGTGVTGDEFDPAAAGAGDHVITYTYTDPNTQCTNSCEFTITVYPLPQISCPDDIEVCIDADPFELMGAGPTGGTYSGVGVDGGEFSPAVAGEGDHVITYTYTDPDTQCTNSCEFTITVHALPEVDCPDDIEVCIDAEPFELLGATPSGGIYSGESVDSAGMFYPSVAGEGDHVITYTYTDPDTECTNSCEFIITVHPLPEVECPDDIEVCIDADPFELTGATPIGGTYSGVGVDAGVFNPEVAGAGDHVITYTYTDPNTECTNSCEFTITVYPLPQISCPDDIEVCIDADPFELMGAGPTGGTYSGVGVDGGEFSPAVAGAGEHVITYTYTDPDTQCTNSCEFTITVHALPEVECPQGFAVCIDADPFELTGATPTDGTYSGISVDSAGMFYPSVAGVGDHVITYTYTDPDTECTNSCEFIITVHPLPEVECPDDMDVCIDDDPFTLTGATPTGGTYSGHGVDAAGIFDPDVAGVGDHVITYTYTDANNCTAVCEFTITVHPSPEVECEPIVVCETDDYVDLLAGEYPCWHSPGEGVYSGPGVFGDAPEQYFDPSIGVGNHEITYTVTDGICVTVETFIITVYPDPDPEIIGPDPVYSGSTEDYYTEAVVLDGFTSLFDEDSWTVDGDGDVVFTDDDITITADCGENEVTLSVNVICGGTISFDWEWLNPGTGDVLFAIEVDGTPVDFSDELSGDVSFDVEAGQTVAFVGYSTVCDEIEFRMSNFGFEVEEFYTWWIDGIVPDLATMPDPVIDGDNDESEVSVYVPWPFTGSYVLWVDVVNCAQCTGVASKTITVLPNRIAGQVKYYNKYEDPMPSPFRTNHDGMEVPDYFYVSLIAVNDFEVGEDHPYYDAVEAVKVKEFYGLEEDSPVFAAHYAAYPYNITYAAAFKFEYNLNPEVEYAVLVWDGGYFDEFDNGNWTEDGTVGVLGKSWTWFNWNPLGSNAVNATDALLINHMVVNNPVNTFPNMSHIVPPPYNDTNPLYNLTDPVEFWAANFNISVADVNGSVVGNPGQPITALDALLTSRRAIGAFEKFPNNKPNFSVAGIFVDGEDFNTNNIFGDLAKPYPSYFFYQGLDNYNWSTLAKEHYYKQVLPEIVGWQEYGMRYLNIYYNSVGDINSSYRPLYGGWKDASDVQLLVKGEMNVSIGDEVTIPVSVTDYAHLGAISIGIDYRNDLIEITGTSFGDNAHYDNETGTLKMAHATLEGEYYEAGSDLVYITVRILSHIDPETDLFALNAFTELADTKAKVIDGLDLSTIALTTEPLSVTDPDAGTISVANFPNPFENTTTIRYTLPEQAEVQLVVYNKMGQIVKTLVDGDQAAGVQEVTVSSSDLMGPGVYYYRLLVNGVYNKYSATNSMVLIR